MRFRQLLIAATILGAPLAAQAQPVTGFYIGAGAGANFMQDEAIKTPASIPLSGTKLETDTGAVGSISAGWGYGNGIRTEIEFNYRYNGNNKLKSNQGTASIGGSEQKFGPMVNVFYDFNGVSSAFVPYVGAGIGYQWVTENISVGGASASQTEGAFAYQGIVGAAFPIHSVPGLSLTGEYRFLGMSTDRTYGSVKFGDNYNHAVMLGLRYAFGAPVPAAAPAPVAPAPAAVAPAPVTRSYLVFFDWDKADLTARARQIVAQAAANSTKVQFTKLDVNGYTDSSGSAKYNQTLSVRRAQSVAAELVRDGVPKSAIYIRGFGETHPLVPTGPNVREPQNRRVEIIIK